MIDGIKIEVFGIDSAVWLNHTDLNFAQTVKTKTGEIDTNKPAIYELDGLNFIISPSTLPNVKPTLRVRGSLHKYANGGKTNADRFDYQRFMQTVKSLEWYGVDPKQTQLESVEYGVNIKLPFPCRLFFDALICANDRKFEVKDFYGESVRGDVKTKIYDKGKVESGKPSDILRVEVKFLKMRSLHRVGIKSLADLMHPLSTEKAKAVLMESLQRLIMLDFTADEIDALPDALQIQFGKWRDAKRWATFSPIKRLNEFNKFAKLSDQLNARTIYHHVLKAVEVECQSLWNGGAVAATRQNMGELPDDWDTVLETNAPTLGKLESGFVNDCTNFQSKKMESSFVLESGFVNDCTNFQSEKMESGFVLESGFNKRLHHYINGETIKTTTTKRKGGAGGNRTITNLGQRTCDSCGTDISHKRPQALFCSTKCKNAETNKIHNPTRERRKTQTEPKTTPSVVEPFDIAAALSKLGNEKREADKQRSEKVPILEQTTLTESVETSCLPQKTSIAQRAREKWGISIKFKINV